MIDLGNSTIVPIIENATYTGKWFEVQQFCSISIMINTDVSGILFGEFSTDRKIMSRSIQLSSGDTLLNSNHSLIVIAKYFRVKLINGSIAQTTMNIQVIHSTESRISLPTSRRGANIDNYTDVLNTRTTSDYINDISLGLYDNTANFNMLGFNNNVNIGSTQIVSSFGGVFSFLTTASTMRIVSTSADDSVGNVGAQRILLRGIDENRETQNEIIIMNGENSVDSNLTFLGLNRAIVLTSGNDMWNNGNILITAVSDGSNQQSIPANVSISQSALYFSTASTTSTMNLLVFKANNLVGSNPKITFILCRWEEISNTQLELYRYTMNTGNENSFILELKIPAIIQPSSVVWVTAQTDKNDTQVSAHFALTAHDTILLFPT